MTSKKTEKPSRKREKKQQKRGPKPIFSRPIAISLRLDADDYEAWKSHAQAAGVPVAIWLREAAAEKMSRQ